MKVAPRCISKNKSGKLHRCTDMSFRDLSPNDVVDKDQVSTPLDSIESFIPRMLKKEKKKGEKKTQRRTLEYESLTATLRSERYQYVPNNK